MDAQYTVLARRFRPQTFTEVVGQEHISQTLRNAIHEGRVAHAYLFTGARGVGKTSMARIFAKALNCPHAVDGVPCNRCEQCLGISAGNDVDVSEIDGASNRGIDDIRSLRANVGVKSMRSKYKVYIIDEVHMLTKEAFNALLKTLEEPPPMVKFVFCTTEPNKVPDTILSRCQRFDFGTISIPNIANRLRQLAEAEGYRVEPAALDLVARRAAGSMRDSQSLFDQLLAFGSEVITDADVHRLLGTAPDDRLISLVDSLIARDRTALLERIDAALQQGVQLEALTDQLINYFRDMMVIACGATESVLLSVGTDQRSKLRQQAERWGLQTIVAAMQILSETKSRMQRVTFGRALAELALIRISMLEELDRLAELITSLNSGRGLALPSAHEASPIPSTMQSDEKKNDSAPAVTSDSPAPTEELVDDEMQLPELDQGPLIQWKVGSEKELHDAVISRMTDMTGTHLRRVASTAIIEPNVLEFCFPVNYDLDRKACDRPDVIAKIEQVVRSVVGKDIRVRFRTSTASPTVDVDPVQPAVVQSEPSTNALSASGRIVDQPQDVFVQDVMAVFGVKGWKVQQMPAESRSENACSDVEEE